MNFIRLIWVCITFLFMFGHKYVYSQNPDNIGIVKGRITDKQNNPLPFVAIAEDDLNNNTTSNSDGYYELKVTKGKHNLIFKSLGYSTEYKTVDVTSNTTILDIVLQELSYKLKEVTIKPGNEDPAYRIMRNVIGRAPYYQHYLKEYSADVYTRGTIKIIKVPKLLLKAANAESKNLTKVKNGDVYLEESVNNIHYTSPNKYEQTVKSYRSTFPDREDSKNVNPMQIIKSSFYEPISGSPIAPDAFNYYRFRYEGFSTEGDNTIFKIKVIPKKDNPELVNGYIFIIDKLWCLYSVDLYQKSFYCNLNYKIIYSVVKGTAWIPVSYFFYIDASIIGINIDFTYVSSVKYKDIKINDKVISEEAKVKTKKLKLKSNKPITRKEERKEKKEVKNQRELDSLMAKKDLTTREMVKLSALLEKKTSTDTVKSLEIKGNESKVIIDKQAVKNNQSYWDSIRPIPLTATELKNTNKNDTLNKSTQDTGSNKKANEKTKHRNQNKYGNYIIGDTRWGTKDSTVRFDYKGLINIGEINFNTVDGFVYKQSLNIQFNPYALHNFSIEPELAYAFSREALMEKLNMNYNYAPLRHGKLNIYIGNTESDFNSEYGLDPNLNSLSSLLFRDNYIKLYKQQTGSITNSIDMFNGFNLSCSIGYASNSPLINHSNYSIFYRNTKEYTSNQPVPETSAQIRNTSNKESYVDVKAEYTPEYYYSIRHGKKRYLYSNYPTFFVNYHKSIPDIEGSTGNYEYAEAGIKQSRSWGLMNSFNWNIKAGKFLDKNSYYLENYKFFNNQPLPIMFSNNNYDVFYLPGIYQNYTNNQFIETHATLSTQYLLLKFLPLLRNKLWLENLHFNYLYTNQTKHYWEAGYSISQIYFIGEVGVYVGFNGMNYASTGIKITINTHFLQ